MYYGIVVIQSSFLGKAYDFWMRLTANVSTPVPPDFIALDGVTGLTITTWEAWRHIGSPFFFMWIPFVATAREGSLSFAPDGSFPDYPPSRCFLSIYQLPAQ